MQFTKNLEKNLGKHLTVDKLMHNSSSSTHYQLGYMYVAKLSSTQLAIIVQNYNGQRVLTSRLC